MSAERDLTAPLLDVSAAPAASDIGFIEDHLTAFNRKFHPVPDNRLPLCVFVRDAKGTILGGATGHTRWDWLYVDCFWLPEAMRQGGLGGRILALAETEAKQRGCARSCLSTYGFQAQGFYAKQGYEVFAVQDDYPPGDRRIWMQKQLTKPAAMTQADEGQPPTSTPFPPETL